MSENKIRGAYPTLTFGPLETIKQEGDKYIFKQLMKLNIDPDVLLEQAMEIQRLNTLVNKYKWRDLRKTPGDLPTESGRYNVVFIDDEYLEGEYRTRYYDTELGWCVEGYDDHSELPGCPREYYLDEIDGEVIGWREIDDFHF